MNTRYSFAFDVLLVAAFLGAVGTARGQSITWTHGLTASTALTIGVRVEPHARGHLDKWLRPLSPYRDARKADGTYLLPDYRLMSHTCDVQHLRWLGIGDWSGPRLFTQAFWLPVGYLGAKLTNAPLAVGGMATYSLSRAFLIRGYHVDPLAYASGFATWGVEGAALGSGHYGWKLPLALGAVWLVAYPYSTPWSGCGR